MQQKEKTIALSLHCTITLIVPLRRTSAVTILTNSGKKRGVWKSWYKEKKKMSRVFEVLWQPTLAWLDKTILVVRDYVRERVGDNMVMH